MLEQLRNQSVRSNEKTKMKHLGFKEWVHRIEPNYAGFPNIDGLHNTRIMHFNTSS